MTTEVDDFLAHYGVAGMRWGKRKAGGSTQKERSDHYQKNPTVRQYTLGVGKDRKDRTESRKNLGKAAVASYLGGVGIKVLATAVPELGSYRLGLYKAGVVLQTAGAVGGAYALAAEGADRAIDRASNRS